MIKNKKAMSQVVTIVIMVVLVLAAVAIIWAVISNLLNDNADQIGLNANCLEIDIQPTMLVCGADYCNVTVTRSATGDDIEGLKISLVYADGTGNDVEDYPNNVEKLETVTIPNLTNNSEISKVEVQPYFLTETGEEYICTNKAERSL